MAWRRSLYRVSAGAYDWGSSWPYQRKMRNGTYIWDKERVEYVRRNKALTVWEDVIVLRLPQSEHRTSSSPSLVPGKRVSDFVLVPRFSWFSFLVHNLKTVSSDRPYFPNYFRIRYPRYSVSRDGSLLSSLARGWKDLSLFISLGLLYYTTSLTREASWQVCGWPWN